MKRDGGKIVFGIVFIAAAVVLFGNLSGWWEIQNIKGWWTLFLIVPGAASMIGSGINAGNTIMVLIGGWLLAREQDWLPDGLTDKMALVIVLAVIGIAILISAFRKPQIPAGPVIFDGVRAPNDPNNTVNYSAIFGGVEASNNSQSFLGGTLTGVFGGVTLDLRSAVPVNGAVIEATGVFGGVDIYAPMNCRIKLTGVPIFGGAECKAPQYNDPNLPLLTIKYTAIFGGVEVK